MVFCWAHCMLLYSTSTHRRKTSLLFGARLEQPPRFQLQSSCTLWWDHFLDGCFNLNVFLILVWRPGTCRAEIRNDCNRAVVRSYRISYDWIERRHPHTVNWKFAIAAYTHGFYRFGFVAGARNHPQQLVHDFSEFDRRHSQRFPVILLLYLPIQAKGQGRQKEEKLSAIS